MAALRFKVWMAALAVCLSAVAVGTQDMPKIAVYVSGAKEQGTNKALATPMLSALVNSGRYQAVERSEEFLRQLDAEHVKQRSGAITDDQIKKLGTQFGVDFVCIADVTAALGSYQVSARIVNVETAGIVAIGHANSNLKSLDELDDASKKIVDVMFGAKTPAAQAQAGGGNAGINVVSGTFTDTRDGKKYKPVKIGSQTWMAENLNYEMEGSKCYNNKPEKCAEYGRLYDWATAKKACPAGWHLATDAEWTTLKKTVGSPVGTKLKSTSGWNSDKGKSGNGTDEYGFLALPGGYGNLDGYFYGAGFRGNWWSATEYGAYNAYYQSMDYSEYVNVGNYGKNGKFSVRCVQD
jgi:uncharacterized protein (TIGR02145 family)